MKTCFYLYISILSIVLLTVSTFAQTATAPLGTGTSGDPYLIETLDNLYWLTQNSSQWTKVFKQIANIDAASTSGWESAQGFSPIGNGTTSFSGTYDGQSYTITDLFINRNSTINMVGMFGYTSAAALSNIKLINVNVTGNATSGGQYVGALIGYETGGSTVTNCSSSGSVTAAYQYSFIGGLIGYQEYESTVQSSYSTCSVSGTGSLPVVGGLVGGQEYAGAVTQCYSAGSVSVPGGTSAVAGGLVGEQRGGIYNSAYCSIANCYSTSTVLGGYTVGGLVGNQIINTTVTNCYSTGAVTGNSSSSVGGLMGSRSGTVTSSFWDTQTSGQATSSGGTGKITTDMKTQSTFLDAGWSGVVWNIGNGINNGYPYLDWQNPSGTPLPVELTTFIASVFTATVTLSWQTATEVNNYGFEVERRKIQNSEVRSQNPEWTKVGFIPGNGTSNAPHNYYFTDENLTAGRFVYRLKQVDNDGTFKYSQSAEVEISAGPKVFALNQNYPNPFNPTTTISFTLTEDGLTTLKVYDILGREVATLVNEELKAAVLHRATFNASTISSGIYFYRLESSKQTQVRKLIFLR